MGIKQIAAVAMILAALLMLFRNYIGTLIVVFIVLVLGTIIIRFLADFYWKGKDKGEW